MNIAYVRVSTVEQNEQRQVEALNKYNIEKWFMEKVSGKNIERVELQNMLDFAREGDIIFVHDFSRLARSTSDLLSIVERLEKKNINLISLKENIDSSTATGKLMLTMIGAIAEFERANILERQKEGIAIAKKQGKYKGRQPAKVKVDDFEKYYKEYMSRKLNKGQLADKLKITRPTLEKFLLAKELNQLKEKHNSYFVETSCVKDQVKPVF